MVRGEPRNAWSVAVLCAVVVAISMVLAPGAAHAQPHRGKQPRDYFLDPPQKGLWLHGDALTLGAQATLESRTPIEDETFGHLAVRGSALASIGYAEAAAHIDIRYLLVTFGASVGYRNMWRTYSGAPGADVSRDIRNDADSAKSFGLSQWGYGEARGRLVIPLDTLWLVTNHALRHEDSPANTYDWMHTNVHDGGFMYRGDAVLFVRTAKYGALGPYARYMNLPRGGERRGELSAGLIYGVRPGLKKRDDLVTLFVLVRPGDDEFGFHVLRLPVWAMLVYRASFLLAD
jgi:hypothetical protein